MISYKNISNNYFLIGLSSDEKPIDGITNGTAYLEMDTGTVYVLDAENARWLELGEETPLPPTPGQSYKHEINWTGYGINDNSGTWENVSGEITGKLTYYTNNETTATTLEELFDILNSNNSKLTHIYHHEETGQEVVENIESEIDIIQSILLFDNKSKLLFENMYLDEYDPETGDSWEARYFVITSFTDTIIPSNN